MSQWSKPAIEEFLEKAQLHYQKIDLPFGLSTPGADRRGTCARIFPGDLAGKTVLDVGCSLGFFCLEALKRGAQRAVGWELTPERVRQAEAVADMLGAPAEYRVQSIEDAAPDERFDIVLCLNVLHHLQDPVAALDRLSRMARETLVLEVATLGGHDARKLKLPRWQRWLLDRSPAMIVAGRHADQSFFLTRAAVIHLLKYQRQRFARVRIEDSDFKNRFIAVAERRRVDHVVIVAGTTSVGKSTFIDAFLENRLPELKDLLGIRSLDGWRATNAKDLADLSDPDTPGLVVHYDFLRAYRKHAKSYRSDKTFDILESARKASVVTLWAPPARLERQFFQNEIAGSRPKKKHGEILEIYRDAPQLLGFYDGWLDFCRGADNIGAHLIVEYETAPKVYAPEEWRKSVARGAGRETALDR